MIPYQTDQMTIYKQDLAISEKSVSSMGLGQDLRFHGIKASKITLKGECRSLKESIYLQCKGHDQIRKSNK